MRRCPIDRPAASSPACSDRPRHAAWGLNLPLNNDAERGAQ
jgi:hypothetical protein